MKARQMSFTTNFYICLSSARTIFCHKINKNSSQFLKSWQSGHAILPKIPDGDTTRNLKPHLMKYSCPILTFIVVHLFCKILKNYLIPRMHHYLIYYLCSFLLMLILGYLASNIVINSSTLYCASNQWVTLFSLQSATITGLLQYNIVGYNWSHRNIMDRGKGCWKHYEYLTDKSKYITQLTPHLL